MSLPSNNRRSYLPALTSLRFLAAIHVVLYHYFPVQTFKPWVESSRSNVPVNLFARGLSNLIGVGYTQVTLFFILSGFILAYTYLNKESERKTSIADFAVSRFARIYPVYLCAWFCAGMYTILLLATHKAKVALPASLVAKDAISSLLCIQAWAPEMARTSWNLPGWSISAEAFFYALFAIAFLGPISSAMKKPGMVFRLTTAALLLKIAATVAYFMLLPDGYGITALTPSWQAAPLTAEVTPWQQALNYSPLMHVGEFLLGVMLAQRFMDRQRPSPIAKIPVALLLAIYVATEILCAAYLPRFMINVVLIPVQALLIYRLAWPSARWSPLQSGAMILLGESSYALYLFHFPLLTWVEAIAKMRAHSSAGEFAFHASLRLPCVIAAVVLSIVIYRFIEVPSRMWVKNWGKKQDRNPHRVPISIAAGVEAREAAIVAE